MCVCTLINALANVGLAHVVMYTKLFICIFFIAMNIICCSVLLVVYFMPMYIHMMHLSLRAQTAFLGVVALRY